MGSWVSRIWKEQEGIDLAVAREMAMVEADEEEGREGDDTER